MRSRLPSTTMAMSWAPMRPALPSALMWTSGTGEPHTRHVAPLRPTVPSTEGPLAPWPISKRTDLPSTIGRAQASLPFFFPNQKERTSGICAPHAGFGQVTVLAQIHAITVASPPPRQLSARVKVADALLGLLAHPRPVVAHVL